MFLPQLILLCLTAVSSLSIDQIKETLTAHDVPLHDKLVQETFQKTIDNSFWDIVKMMKARLDQLPKTVDPDTVDDWTKCALGFADIIGSFTSNRSTGSDMMSAITMIDSASKIPSGLLKGNFRDFGQYDECLGVEKNSVLIKVPGIEPLLETSYTGHHCLIAIAISLPKSASLSNNETSLKWNVKSLSSSGLSTISLTVAQCYPSTCKPEMIQTIWTDLLVTPSAQLLNTSGVKISATVDSSTCHTKERRMMEEPFDGLDWFVIFLICLLVLIGFSCSLIDMYHLRKVLKDRSPTVVEQLVMAFSVHRNGTKLFSTTQNAEQMNCINGMKFISICWVVIGHRYSYVLGFPVVNADFMIEAVKQWHKMMMLNAILSVDTFFVISGLLNAYVFFNLMDKKIKYNIVTVFFGYLHRYLRLTPSYLMMMGVTATLITRTGDGPMWDGLAGGEKNNCRTHWWSGLTYLNNYLNPEANCMMQSWYLAADMQMFWASPLILYPMYRWPKIGLFNLFLATAASVASPFAVSYTNNIKAPLPVNEFDDPGRAGFEMKVLYLPTHTKTVSYVFGIFVGYIIQKQRSGKLKWKLNWISATIGWLLGLTSLLYGLFGCYPLFQINYTYTQLEASLYLGFYRLFWSIGVGWILFACISDFGGIVNFILSVKPFGPLGRLSYCIYLTHIVVLVYSVGTTRVGIFFTDYDQVITFMGEMVVITVLAAMLSLLLESPMMTIEKIIFGGGGRGGPSKRHQKHTPTQPTTIEIPRVLHATENVIPPSSTEITAPRRTSGESERNRSITVAKIEPPPYQNVEPGTKIRIE